MRCTRLGFLVILAITFVVLSVSGLVLGSVSADTPPWAEPRALNVVDLAGQVADEILRDHIICYGGPGGLNTYVSSSLDGNKLRIRVRMHPRYFWIDDRHGWGTAVASLGHTPVLDRMSSSTPESWVRIYQGKADVTDQVVYYTFAEPDLALPTDPVGDPRYSAEYHPIAVQHPSPADGIHLPANWGGYLAFHAKYDSLTAVFTVHLGNRPKVTYLGHQDLTYPSYIGPGYVGWFGPLMDQMRSKYRDRHPRLAISKPDGANYILFVYDPMPFDLDAGFWAKDADLFAQNRDQPVAGTVRLAGEGGMLSQDLNHAGAFPLGVWWQDADQSAGPYLSVFTTDVQQITPPEFVVLPGASYDSCFVSGGCGKATLADIFNARATLTVVYLKVEPVLAGVRAIPLRVADTNWTSAASVRPQAQPMAPFRYRAFLPVVESGEPVLVIPPERPIGFFDPVSGRMVGYLAD